MHVRTPVHGNAHVYTNISEAQARSIQSRFDKSYARIHGKLSLSTKLVLDRGQTDDV